MLWFCSTVRSYFPPKVLKKVDTFLFCSWRRSSMWWWVDVMCTGSPCPCPSGDSWVTLCCSSRSHFLTNFSQKGMNLFENTVNSWTVKNNYLDANGLFLMSFQFLYPGFMFEKQHHLFVLLTSEWWCFFLWKSPLQSTNRKGAIMFQTVATQASIQSSFSRQKIYAFLNFIFLIEFCITGNTNDNKTVRETGLLKCCKYKK